MSRGLGKWERLLIHAVYHNPTVPTRGRPAAWASDLASTPSEYSAIQRAARSIARKGLVLTPHGCANRLEPLPVIPAEAQRPCPRCLSVQENPEVCII